MQAYFPAEVLELLHHVGESAAALDLRVFLIGGSIRDLLLPHREFDWDIDLVVEHRGAEALGQEMQRRCGGQLQIFEQYGTAKLKFDQRLHLDIATARTETYAHPGANPKVSFSDLHADLIRRDFTINAMAIALLPGEFGELIDYFNGYQDLEHRLLRTLHENKFREDPVRCWRACRLQHALSFQIESQTAQLISETMQTGIFDRFFSPRIRTELRKVLSFADPLPSLLALEALNVLRCLDPELRLNENLLGALNRLEQWEPWFAEAHDQWAAPLCLLLEALSVPRRAELIPHLELNQHQVRSWEAIVVQTEKMLALNWKTLKPHQVYQTLKPIPDLTLWFWLARFPESELAQAAEYFWGELRLSKPEISGHDLKTILKPGPQMREILEKLHHFRLDGLVHSKEEEFALAQKWAQELKEVL